MRSNASEPTEAEYVEPRAIWADEPRDFTPWLAEQLGQLSSALGIELQLRFTETHVGWSRADMVGFDNTHEGPFVIENQLSRANHDHLARLQEYARNNKAVTAIMVATEFREREIEFIRGMNEDMPHRRHFGVEVVPYRRGGSQPQVEFIVRVAPPGWDIPQASTQVTRPRVDRAGRPVRVRGVRREEADTRYSALWTAVESRLEAEGLDWAKSWTFTRPVHRKMRGPVRDATYQFDWYNGEQLQSKFSYYGRADRIEVIKALSAHALERWDSLEQAYGGKLMFKPQGQRNRGTEIYDALQAPVAAAKDVGGLAEWLVETNKRLRVAVVSVLDVQRFV